jgi:hypothetical protein
VGYFTFRELEAKADVPIAPQVRTHTHTPSKAHAHAHTCMRPIPFADFCLVATASCCHRLRTEQLGSPPPATSAPGLASPLSYPNRPHSCHICTWTGLVFFTRLGSAPRPSHPLSLRSATSCLHVTCRATWRPVPYRRLSPLRAGHVRRTRTDASQDDRAHKAKVLSPRRPACLHPSPQRPPVARTSCRKPRGATCGAATACVRACVRPLTGRPAQTRARLRERAS